MKSSRWRNCPQSLVGSDLEIGRRIRTFAGCYEVWSKVRTAGCTEVCTHRGLHPPCPVPKLLHSAERQPLSDKTLAPDARTRLHHLLEILRNLAEAIAGNEAHVG